jgi:CheY-like chemotaxis protein
VFEIWWPLQPAASHDPRNIEHGEQSGVGLAGKTVLVVDDNPAVVETLVEMLEQVGAEVGPCLNPRDAVAAVKDDPAAWDLVISDYDMPGMNGEALARTLRKLRPDLAILLLTALPRVHQLHQGPDKLFDGVLGKPTSAARLATSAAAAMTVARERSTICVS